MIFLAALTLIAAADRPSDKVPDFARDVLPVFAKYCYGCHATGIKMGSFECDTYEGVMNGANHGSVVVPGKPEDSRLYLTLAGKMSPAMPLSKETLTPKEIAVVKDWIAAGAKPPAKVEKK